VAKRANEHAPQRPNGSLRVRLYEVEVNGADTTIEEALRAIERMRRPVIDAPSAPKRIASSVAPVNGDTALPDDPTLFDNLDQVQADAPTAEIAPDAANDIAGTDLARKKRGDGDRKDRNAGIKPVGDINFVPNGKQSLKAFFAAKAPDSDMDQILVLCHFLRHTVQCDQIGPGHILSGFKHVGKPVPKDLKKTIRNMKDKKAWLNFTDIENIGLTTEGDNRVEYELGNGSGDAGAK
jgi:hypothetical protein